MIFTSLPCYACLCTSLNLEKENSKGSAEPSFFFTFSAVFFWFSDIFLFLREYGNYHMNTM